MFGIGPGEMVLLALIGLLLFGKRLPEVARQMGKSMMEFKKGMSGIHDELNTAVYSSSSRSSTATASRPMPRDEGDEVSAPKFEPPKFEPTT